MKIKVREAVKDIEVTTISVVESFDESWKMWNCPTCKNPIFRYKGTVVQIFPGFIPTEIPVVLQCSNSSCRHNYLLNSVLSREVFLG